MSITVEKADQRLTTRWRWEVVATKWATDSGHLMKTAIEHAAPVGKRPESGRLRESIQFVPKVSSTAASIEFYSRVPYARYVIDGTPAHVIVPRNARVLRWQQGGQWVYRQRVNHPGARANPFAEKAVRPLVPVISRKMKNMVVNSLGSL